MGVAVHSLARWSLSGGSLSTVSCHVHEFNAVATRSHWQVEQSVACVFHALWSDCHHVGCTGRHSGWKHTDSPVTSSSATCKSVSGMCVRAACRVATSHWQAHASTRAVHHPSLRGMRASPPPPSSLVPRPGLHRPMKLLRASERVCVFGTCKWCPTHWYGSHAMRFGQSHGPPLHGGTSHGRLAAYRAPRSNTNSRTSHVRVTSTTWTGL